jgi:hypothetical protein
MKKLTYLFLLLTLSIFTNSCTEDIEFTKNLNFVTFEAAVFEMGVDIGGTKEYEVKVFATQKSGNDRTFNLKVVPETTTASAATYTVPASVTIPAGSTEGVFKVNLTDVNIGDGKVLVLDIEPQDGLYKGNATKINISQVCPFNDVRLNLIFDGYASECTWELFDSSNNVIASGGPWADGTKTASAKFCLANGTYTFTIYDAYGDGLSYPSNGSATLIANGVEKFSIVGDFGDEASRTFTLNK